MPKTVNAVCLEIIKVKNSFNVSGIYFSSWEFWGSVAAPDTLCFKGLRLDVDLTNAQCRKLLDCLQLSEHHILLEIFFLLHWWCIMCQWFLIKSRCYVFQHWPLIVKLQNLCFDFSDTCGCSNESTKSMKEEDAIIKFKFSELMRQKYAFFCI